MARPKAIRKMVTPPKFKGFKPYGYYSEELEPVTMLFEEYETIRLCDYELYSQAETAEFMCVSRPTVTRIYESARRKVALAFAEARAIVIEGGKVYFDEEWFRCINCGSHFNNPDKKTDLKNCPVCNSKLISKVNSSDSDKIKKKSGSCICPVCGCELPYQSGVQCSTISCPKCGRKLSRIGKTNTYKVKKVRS